MKTDTDKIVRHFIQDGWEPDDSVTYRQMISVAREVGADESLIDEVWASDEHDPSTAIETVHALRDLEDVPEPAEVVAA